jgi:acetyl esterase/lipase
MRPEKHESSFQEVELERVAERVFPPERPPPPRATVWPWAVAGVLVLVMVSGGAALSRRIAQWQEQKQQDQVLIELEHDLVEASNANDDARFEEVAARLEASLPKTTPDMRLLGGVILGYQRDLRQALKAREKIVEKLNAVLDGSGLTTPESVRERIGLLREYARLNVRVLELASDPPAALLARVRAAGASELLITTFRKGLEQGVGKQSLRDKALLRAATALRGSEKQWAEACVAALIVLEEEWGRWSWDAKATQFVFQDDAARNRWNEALRRVHDDELVMNRDDARQFVLDPANKLEAPQPTPLLSVRKAFVTALLPPAPREGGAAPLPPPGVFQRIRYRSPAGSLVAYVTPDPRDGKKRPAVLWAHGGFYGVDSYLWERAPADNDQSVRAFLEEGLVVMCPSWRGENDNPGRLELFYGEVEDLLAAREHLASLPYVDSSRIYLAGHSTGGTLTLLAAASTDLFRAAFSFGGAPDMVQTLATGGYGNTPFDIKNETEARMRSPSHVVGAISRPTHYFEGETSSYVNDAFRMEALARFTETVRGASRAGAEPAQRAIPFSTVIVRGGDHFTILRPLTRLVARKITEDTGPAWVEISADEAQRAFDSAALAAP